jgi:hypothetical protein
MNKKGIFIVIILIILAVVGYYAMGSKTDTAVENTDTTAEVVKDNIPEGVTKDTYAPVTKDSTDTSLLGRLKSVSVGVTEDGTKITLAGGKADFTISGSSVKGSVSVGDIAITKTVKDRTDVLASLSVSTGSTKTAYVVLFDDKAGTLSDKSYAVIGTGATVTGLRADDISTDGDYVVSVSYKDSKGAHTKLLTVLNGEFNLAKTIDF